MTKIITVNLAMKLAMHALDLIVMTVLVAMLIKVLFSI